MIERIYPEVSYQEWDKYNSDTKLISRLDYICGTESKLIIQDGPENIKYNLGIHNCIDSVWYSMSLILEQYINVYEGVQGLYLDWVHDVERTDKMKWKSGINNRVGSYVIYLTQDEKKRDESYTKVEEERKVLRMSNKRFGEDY
jgi:hypothetical protein